VYFLLLETLKTPFPLCLTAVDTETFVLTEDRSNEGHIHKVDIPTCDLHKMVDVHCFVWPLLATVRCQESMRATFLSSVVTTARGTGHHGRLKSTEPKMNYGITA